MSASGHNKRTPHRPSIDAGFAFFFSALGNAENADSGRGGMARAFNHPRRRDSLRTNVIAEDSSRSSPQPIG